MYLNKNEVGGLRTERSVTVYGLWGCDGGWLGEVNFFNVKNVVSPLLHIALKLKSKTHSLWLMASYEMIYTKCVRSVFWEKRGR